MELVKQKLSFLSPKLLNELLDCSTIQIFPKGVEILKEEQYVKVLPIVLNGLVKVSSHFQEKELLLYYIEPKQSCVMSFSSALNQEPSRVFAITEQETEILLIPVQNLSKWLKEYPELNTLFYNQYDLRYLDLLNTIQQLFVAKMDVRLMEYLERKTKLMVDSTLKLTHLEIANDLGTAREVISRTMKKLEIEGRVQQSKNGIKVLT
ncbi:MAG: Crp/Fnr family transcriptional regulator [Flavobacteriales bacterium]